jgi:hypothetical protein
MFDLQSNSRFFDLFCGSGGWPKASPRHNWIGVDCVRDFSLIYPGEFVWGFLPEVLPHVQAGDVILASPPCEVFARHHLPWLLGKRHPDELTQAVKLLEWSLSLIDRWQGVHVVVECSRFAALHVTDHPARLCASYALWGDLPVLLSDPPRRKSSKSGKNPASRAEVEPWLAVQIIDYLAFKSRICRNGGML